MREARASYFIYYRVAVGRLAAALPLIAAVQNDVRAVTGVRGRIYSKDDGSNTWMEVYEGVSDCARFEKSLEASIAGTGFMSLLDAGSQRRVERFLIQNGAPSA